MKGLFVSFLICFNNNIKCYESTNNSRLAKFFNKLLVYIKKWTYFCDGVGSFKALKLRLLPNIYACEKGAYAGTALTFDNNASSTGAADGPGMVGNNGSDDGGTSGKGSDAAGGNVGSEHGGSDGMLQNIAKIGVCRGFGSIVDDPGDGSTLGARVGGGIGPLVNGTVDIAVNGFGA